MHPLFFSVILLLVVVPPAFGLISDRTGLNQDFTIETGGHVFTVDVTSNFNVEDVAFSSDDKRLTFYINSGLENNLAEIQIPKNLTNGNFTFMLNDQEIFPIVKTNEKISFITVEFEGSGKNKLDIIGTTHLPESSEIAPLILFASIAVIIFALIVVIIFARKIKKLGNYSFNKD
ncbi:MAG: hypothetical protein ACREAL_00800 [Nitrosopumilaceae archaeon]